MVAPGRSGQRDQMSCLSCVLGTDLKTADIQDDQRVRWPSQIEDLDREARTSLETASTAKLARLVRLSIVRPGPSS